MKCIYLLNSILEGQLEDCHLKLGFKMEEGKSRRFYDVSTFPSTPSLCAEACTRNDGCSGFSFQPLISEWEKCKLFSESVFATTSENGTAVVGWCPKGN